MRTKVWPDQEVTGWTTCCLGFALPGQPDDHAVINSRRDVNLERVRSKEVAGAMTGLTRRLNPMAKPLAFVAGGEGDHPHSLSRFDLLFLPGPFAFRARGGRGAGLGSRGLTCSTVL